MMVFFTGRTRAAGSILQEQKENIKNKNEILEKMARQAREARDLLVAGKIGSLGKLMDEGWKLKRQLASRISDPEIDRIYGAAKSRGDWGKNIWSWRRRVFDVICTDREKRDGKKSGYGLPAGRQGNAGGIIQGRK